MNKHETVMAGIAIILLGIVIGTLFIVEATLGDERADSASNWFGESWLGSWIESKLLF